MDRRHRVLDDLAEETERLGLYDRPAAG
jgi:hypothetical protein